MKGPLGRCLEARTANLYRRCLNEGEPVLISNFTLRRFRLFQKLSVSERELRKRKRLSEEVEHLRPFKKRAIVLEDQFDAQRTDLEASKKQADEYHRRFNEERRRSHSLAVEDKKLKAKIKNLRVRVVRQRARAVHWREKMKAWGARQRAKAKLFFSFRKGGCIPAKGRQLHYDLHRHRVAGNQHTNVVYDVLRFLGLTSRLGKVCSPTAIKRMRTESGSFSIKCVAGSMKESKELDLSLSFGHSRDGTGRRGIPYQVDATHFQAPNGELASGIIGVHLPPNKKATTQVKATTMSFHNLKQLSQGVLEPSDCKTRITDGANNEKATNNPEGQPWTNCLQHNGSNTTKHGVAPTFTTGWIDCTCGQEKPPIPPTANNLRKWCGCVVCKTWVHEECVAPVVNPFICRTCCNLGARALEGDIK